MYDSPYLIDFPFTIFCTKNILDNIFAKEKYFDLIKLSIDKLGDAGSSCPPPLALLFLIPKLTSSKIFLQHNLFYSCDKPLLYVEYKFLGQSWFKQYILMIHNWGFWACCILGLIESIYILFISYLYPSFRLAHVQNQLGVFRTRQGDLLASFNLLSEVGASTLLNTSNDFYAMIRTCISASRLDTEIEARLLARLDELTGISHSNARMVLGAVN